MSGENGMREFVAEREEWLISRLEEWLRIPSISGAPEHADDVARSAEWFADRLREVGFPTVEVWDGPAAPAVYAHWSSGVPGAPRVLVYGHHDVQPGGSPEQWDAAPFTPVRRDGRIVGRGAVDDKGQMIFHLLGLLAHLEATGRSAPEVDLTFLVEGEEEIGSPGLERLLRERRDQLDCDVVAVTDNGIWGIDRPSVCTGMRGVLRARLTVDGARSVLHSGTYGGALPNPATVLARVLGRFHDDDGRVTIPGFYDRVRPLTERERKSFASLGFDEATWLAAAGATSTHGEAGFSTLERTWGRPTAEVNAMWGGATDGTHEAVIPATATALLSFRLVADQDPAEVGEALRGWLAETIPADVAWDLQLELPGTLPCLAPDGHWALEALLDAMGETFEREILYTRDGGSGPGAVLARELAAPVIFVGTGMSTDGAHAPNESIDVSRVLQGAEVVGRLWSTLARHAPPEAGRG